MSYKRKQLDKKKSKRMFRNSAGAMKTHPKNMLSSMPMRGGIRL